MPNLHRYTVIDEADELLGTGWEDFMEFLFQTSSQWIPIYFFHNPLTMTGSNVDGDHTVLMFSATFPRSARKLAREYMEDDFVRIKVGRVGSTHMNIKQTIVYVEENLKNQALYDLLFSGGPARTLIFVNSKARCDMVDDFLYNRGLPTTSIHSDRTQREREDAL